MQGNIIDRRSNGKKSEILRGFIVITFVYIHSFTQKLCTTSTLHSTMNQYNVHATWEY